MIFPLRGLLLAAALYAQLQAGVRGALPAENTTFTIINPQTLLEWAILNSDPVNNQPIIGFPFTGGPNHDFKLRKVGSRDPSGIFMFDSLQPGMGIFVNAIQGQGVTLQNFTGPLNVTETGITIVRFTTFTITVPLTNPILAVTTDATSGGQLTLQPLAAPNSTIGLRQLWAFQVAPPF
ncbi:hypothetical protein EXIGLDRAFT_734142 [Exidia glandulosa HHB12029]|uniref:Uncharacterized protein n=1 Tax=Exidia glandulosa HHB12029 TaxID=1314781 RepID=A0A165B5E0_EXIGL|nr:hypothetical protein EXIGLDRAFT_734142 [Exidia glandulosa HHB12029]